MGVTLVAALLLLVNTNNIVPGHSRHTQPDCASSTGGADDHNELSVERGETGVRLVGGCSSRSGELQVKPYLSRDWRSVCYDSFDYFDAQFACAFLGFPFVASIYEISTYDSMSTLGFEYSCTADDLASGIQHLRSCSSFREQPSCKSYAGVICDTEHSPSEGFIAIVVYNYGAKFDIIAPDDGLFVEDCNAAYGFCHGVYFGHKNNSQLELLITILRAGPAIDGATQYCGDHGNIAKFGISCSPIPGDPVLTIEIDGRNLIKTEGLVWYFDEEFEWTNVCEDGLGYIEAQVLCNSIGFPYFSYLELASQSPNPSHSGVVSSIRCVGSEKRLSECEINIVNTSDANCTWLSTVGCGGSTMESINDIALVFFEPVDNLSHQGWIAGFTLISPSRGLHLTNCTMTVSTSDHYCPGVHLISSNNTGLQDVYLDPMNCQGIPYRLFGKQCDLATVAADGSTTFSQANEFHSNSIIVPLSVSSVLLVIIVLAAGSGVGCFLGYRNIKLKRADKAGREIIKDLKERQMSVTSANGFNKYSQIRKYHKPVTRRRSSGMHRRIGNEHWEIPFECITLGEELGSGAYGTICKGVIDCSHQDQSVDVAVKLLKRYATESERRSLLQEIDMMKDIGYHRHVISMLACCTQGNHFALVMEFMPCGNLQTFLRKHRSLESEPTTAGHGSLKVPNPYILGVDPSSISVDDQFTGANSACKHTLSLMEQLQFARQIILGMEYLAGLKVVHRDLATRNVLIDEEMFLKVSDFGLSRDIYSDNSYHMAHTKDKLPVRWMALESIIDREFSVESDVWSFGVVLWEIITCGSFPYYHMTNMEVITGIRDGYRLPKPESCPDKVYDIMKMCWQQAPSQRPSFYDLRGMLDALLDKGEYTSLM